jgi:arsenate reductase
MRFYQRESNTPLGWVHTRYSLKSSLSSREFYGYHFEIDSAGLEPAEAVNPLVVKVMDEVGIDLSKKKPKNAFKLFKQGNLYDHVITVCHDSES